MNSLETKDEKLYLRPKLIELSKEEEKKPLNSEELEKLFKEKFSFTDFTTIIQNQ